MSLNAFDNCPISSRDRIGTASSRLPLAICRADHSSKRSGRNTMKVANKTITLDSTMPPSRQQVHRLKKASASSRAAALKFHVPDSCR